MRSVVAMKEEEEHLTAPPVQLSTAEDPHETSQRWTRPGAFAHGTPDTKTTHSTHSAVDTIGASASKHAHSTADTSNAAASAAVSSGQVEMTREQILELFTKYDTDNRCAHPWS